MHTPILTFLLATAWLLALPQPSHADELDILKSEVEALKKEQAAIRQELKELKASKAVVPRRGSMVEEVDASLSIAGLPSKGAAEARLILVEFTDYQCPFCARHAQGVLPQLLRDYVQTGKVRYVMRDLPLSFHQHAAKAAEAAHCAGDQGKYWEMHDELFANQKDLGLEALPQRAAAIGLDMDAFQTCLGSGKYTALVGASASEGAKAGIQGTPTFFLGVVQADGTKINATKSINGAQGYAAFKQAIESLLASQNSEVAGNQ